MDNQIKISKTKCHSIYIDNNGKRFHCHHPALEGENYCIFHSQNEKKKDIFNITLWKLIERIEVKKDITEYDFKGFYFPEISFKKHYFTKTVDLRGAIFSGDVDFENAEFRSNLIGHKTYFNSKAFFQGAIFDSNVSFVGSEFDKLILKGGISNHKFIFQGCKFKNDAIFSGRTFNGPLKFHSCRFYKDVDFSFLVAREIFSMHEVKFEKRARFINAQFYDEIILSNSEFSYLKNIKTSGIDFKGTVLHSTNLYDNEDLADLKFNNAFLMSCDFSNKRITNCDFTGAVLKEVRFENTSIDDKTNTKTKFIYTDYYREEIDNDDQTLLKHQPKISSRIPLVGFFGEGDNIDFTFKDFLHEPYKWIFILDLPNEIRTGIVNYVNFFRDFAKSTEDLDVNFSMSPEGQKTRVSLLTHNFEAKEKIINSFKKYINNIFSPFESLQLEFRNPNIGEEKKNRFLINYKNELDTARLRLQYGLQSIEDTTRTVTSLDHILESKNDENRNLWNLLNKMVENKPPIPQLNFNVNQETSVNVENTTELRLELSKLEDALLNESDEKNSRLIEDLVEQIKEIKEELKTPIQKANTKSRIKKIVEFSKKLGDYGIKNYANISKIVETLSKIVSGNV